MTRTHPVGPTPEDTVVRAPAPVFGQDPGGAARLGPRLTSAWGHVTGGVPAGSGAYAEGVPIR